MNEPQITEDLIAAHGLKPGPEPGLKTYDIYVKRVLRNTFQPHGQDGRLEDVNHLISKGLLGKNDSSLRRAFPKRIQISGKKHINGLDSGGKALDEL